MTGLHLRVAALAFTCISSMNIHASYLEQKGAMQPIGNIGGSTGAVFPNGKSRLVLNSIYFSKDNIYDGDSKMANPSSKELDTWTNSLTYRHGLGNGFDVRINVPYISKKLTQTLPSGPKKGEKFTFKQSGIGDVKIIARYQILHPKKGDDLLLAIGGGIKLPTGKHDKTFTNPMGVQTNPPNMRLGSGSVDYLAEIGLTKFLKNGRIDVHLMYDYKTKGKHQFEYGDQFKWSTGYSHALTPLIDWQIEAVGFHNDKNRQDGQSIASSGGDTIFIMPGVHFKFKPSFDMSFGYAYPIYRDLNSGGLGEPYRIYARFGYNF